MVNGVGRLALPVINARVNLGAWLTQTIRRLPSTRETQSNPRGAGHASQEGDTTPLRFTGCLRDNLTDIEKQVGRLINAVAKGVNPTLLVSKQMELKEQAERAAERLRLAEAKFNAIPSKELLQHQIAILRLQLLAKVQSSDRRTLTFEEVRRFLIILFGENPAKEGNGISIFREHGRWRISFKGKVEFFHDIDDGRPLLHAVRKHADRANTGMKRELEKRVALIRKT